MHNPRRTNSTRRNRVVARVKAEETDCWLCGEPVDKTLPPHLPDSPEVDEVLPVSKGGDPYDRANCRLAHRKCNRLRGNGDNPIARTPDTISTTRRWSDPLPTP